MWAQMPSYSLENLTLQSDNRQMFCSCVCRYFKDVAGCTLNNTKDHVDVKSRTWAGRATNSLLAVYHCKQWTSTELTPQTPLPFLLSTYSKIPLYDDLHSTPQLTPPYIEASLFISVTQLSLSPPSCLFSPTNLPPSGAKDKTAPCSYLQG